MRRLLILFRWTTRLRQMQAAKSVSGGRNDLKMLVLMDWLWKAMPESRFGFWIAKDSELLTAKPEIQTEFMRQRVLMDLINRQLVY